MKLINKLNFLFKNKQKKNSTVSSSQVLFEVIEKSKTHNNREYHYKASIRLNSNNSTEPNFGVIAWKIQNDMGFHPMGYDSYGIEHRELNEGLIELTWKSWDSCD